jgi:hypothetical protein
MRFFIFLIAFIRFTFGQEPHQKQASSVEQLLEKNNETPLLSEVLIYLEKLKQNRPEIAHLITGGLELILDKVTLH